MNDSNFVTQEYVNNLIGSINSELATLTTASEVIENANDE